MRTSGGFSRRTGIIYHSLQTSYTKRFTNNLSIDANYTWSHAIDDVDDQGLFDSQPQDVNNFRAERGNSSGGASVPLGD